MMRTLYLDCYAGIAGDMFIGALLNLIPNPEIIKDEIAKIHALDSDEYKIIIEHTTKNGIAGLNFDVVPRKRNNNNNHHHDTNGHEHHHRHLSDIEAMITGSDLSVRVKRETLRAFSILAEAEAHVHGTTPDKIHFHEVGAVDSIIDIAGAFVLMEALGWPRVISSPVNVGSGTVNCAHGTLPVPAPAAEYLLRDIPVFSAGSPMERTTPTGALLIKILADGFGTMPAGRITASGFGFGNNESEDMPNALRAVILESSGEIEGLVRERLSLIECNIDDMNPQDYEPVCGKLFEAGALDVWFENVMMKKSRPGIKLCCLCGPDDAVKMSRIILTDTTSQGVRLREYDRLRLNWRIEEADTSLGKVRVKVTEIDGGVLRRVPEYEDVKALAVKHNLPMWDVRRAILREI